MLHKGPSSRKAAERLPTVEEFAATWLEHGRAKRHRPSTMQNKAAVLRCHLLPLLGKLRLNEVTDKTLAMVTKKPSDRRVRGVRKPKDKTQVLELDGNSFRYPPRRSRQATPAPGR